MVLVTADLVALSVALDLAAESLAMVDFVVFLDARCIFGGFGGSGGSTYSLSSGCITVGIGIGGC